MKILRKAFDIATLLMQPIATEIRSLELTVERCAVALELAARETRRHRRLVEKAHADARDAMTFATALAQKHIDHDQGSEIH